PADSTHADAGKEIEKEFTAEQCETDDEALATLSKLKGGVLKLVNNHLKLRARSNAYQAAMLPYRQTEVPQEDIVERMVRDFIRLGISEETVRAQVNSLLAAQG